MPRPNLAGWCGLLLLTMGGGCAIVRVQSFDAPTRSVALCGNRWAGPPDFDKAAQDHCGARAEVQRCAGYSEIVGVKRRTDAQGNERASIVRADGSCCEYRCL